MGTLVVETVVRVRREYAGGKPMEAIARDLRLSRKVVRKAIRAPEGSFDYHRRCSRCRGSDRSRSGSIRC